MTAKKKKKNRYKWFIFKQRPILGTECALLCFLKLVRDELLGALESGPDRTGSKCSHGLRLRRQVVAEGLRRL